MNLEEFSKEFRLQADRMELQITDVQIEKFFKYKNLLLEWNEKINLTAITDEKEIIVKHFIDSILVSTHIKNEATVIDVGTGAGFPGIPLKIYDESIKLTLLDSLNKRTVFLQEVVDSLDLKDVTVIHSRAEDGAQDRKYRETFDYAISRAVAPLNVLLEYLVPYVKVNGNIIAMKGINANEEIVISRNAIEKLNVEITEKEKISLPNDAGDRFTIILNKKKPTNKIYPRKAGTPKKNPL